MDSTLACLAEWMPRQRWYTSKGHTPDLRLLIARDLPGPDASARVRVLIIADDSARPPVVYQVPVVERAADPADIDALIGVRADGIRIIDGPRDPAFTSALWPLLQGGSAEMGTDGGGSSERSGSHTEAAHAHRLTGEQSNTSIVFEPAHGMPVICKLFRQLNPGLNPDIELPSALSDAGSAHVPRMVGHVDGEWPDAGTGTSTTGSLALAQEFLPGVEDAWRAARRSAANGDSFAAAAHALGAATADVHVRLSELFPVERADGPGRQAVSVAWRRRLSIAVDEVPSLARHAAAISEVYARALRTVWPPLQRIHGDYHLGQVLHAPGRGWVLVDFEGEPMRPIDERRRPDSALRDVAGMLRSFDYVVGSLAQESGTAPAAWGDDARRSFLGGYEGRAGAPVSGPLLDAFELDKAVYEAIYETRNRPDWLAIPLAAVDRLLSSRRGHVDLQPGSD